MPKKIIIAGGSNWETMLFLLMNRLTLSGKVTIFYRTQLLSTFNQKTVTAFSAMMGHKFEPQHISETMQNTLQQMRDKGFVQFKGDGEYELTARGCQLMTEKCQAADRNMKSLFGISGSSSGRSQSNNTYILRKRKTTAD